MFKIILIVFYLLGFLCAAMAILRSRTPQGATAWVLSLLTFPFLAVPAYILVGKNRFDGYSSQRRLFDEEVEKKFEIHDALKIGYLHKNEEMRMLSKLVSPKNQPGFTRRNSIRLLVDAKETFPEILKALEKAREYIIFQFYVVRADATGKLFFDVLIRKARQGIKVTFMNDAIGVVIPKNIMNDLIRAGVNIGVFNQSTKKGKLQVNFRNHRKIVIVDGEVAFLGGLNIGDEYQGLTSRFGPWRDTAVRLEGPSVIAAQLSAAKDWYCIHERPLKANWKIKPSQEDASVMVLHSGPADEKHTCLLGLIALINAASTKLWIANPYYVPPDSLMDAILLASLRGVDVRILLPGYSDAKLVMLASKVYQKKLLQHGIRVFQYTKGFLHQKVILIDNQFAVVGSANLDYRSMFINFEIQVITSDLTFLNDCALMLEKDFLASQELLLEDFQRASILTEIAARGANLLAPIL